MKKFKFVFLMFFCLCMQAGSFVYASSFIGINVNNDISFDIPRNWVVLSDNKTITLNSIIESILPVTSSVRFQANLKDDNGKPITTVQIYRWSSEFYQADIDSMGESDMSDYNQQMRSQMVKELKAAGGTVSKWHGTRKSYVNDLVVLVSEYSRPSALGLSGQFRVQVLRVYSGDRSFSFVISYHEDNILPLRVLVDKIITTLRCSHCT